MATVKAVDKLQYSLDDVLMANLSEAVAIGTVSVSDIVVNGRGLHTMVGGATVSGTLARTTAGASTLTLVFQDQDRTIRNLIAMKASGTVKISGETFVFVAGSGNGAQFTATYEDDVVHRLMKNKKKRKFERGKLTRAEAIIALARDERVPVICPEAGITQKIATGSTTKVSSRTHQPGFARGTGSIKVKGHTATAHQRKVITEVLGVGTGRHVSNDALVAAVMTITQESFAGDDQDHGRGGSWGIFSQTPSAGWGTVAQVSNTIYATNKFLNAFLAAKHNHPKFTLGQLCDNVQAPAVKGSYRQWQAEARATVAAFNGGSISVTHTGTETYEFDVGVQTKGESHWAGMQRLASEVNWLLWADQGALYYMSYEHLFKSQSLFKVDAMHDDILSVSWSCDTGQKSQSASVECFMTRWAAPPGTLVHLDNEGIATGRWLVETVTTNLTNMQGSIELKRFEPAVLEPAAAATTSSGALSGSGVVDDTTYNISSRVPVPISKVYTKAKQIASKNYPYQWGGGHVSSFAPSMGGSGGPHRGSRPGYDCSGAVSAALHAGGLLGTPEASPALESWGAAGEGYYMTVWSSSVHTWIEFKHINGSECFSTGGAGNADGGPSFQAMHSKSGFTPRHLKGA